MRSPDELLHGPEGQAELSRLAREDRPETGCSQHFRAIGPRIPADSATSSSPGNSSSPSSSTAEATTDFTTWTQLLIVFDEKVGFQHGCDEALHRPVVAMVQRIRPATFWDHYNPQRWIVP